MRSVSVHIHLHISADCAFRNLLLVREWLRDQGNKSTNSHIDKLGRDKHSHKQAQFERRESETCARR
jgi:hypothetical protein